ncbi:hypothetical protein ACQ4PT_012684 [Festuca glaucescens]
MEPRGASRRRSGTLLILFAVFLAAAAAASASASAIGDKCAACKAVAVSSSLLLCLSLASANPRESLVRRQNEPGSSGIYCSRSSRIFETAVWFGRHIVEAEVSDGSFDLVFLQAELEIGMSSEKPRNHLDLRNRLNSKGQREGKVIDYRVSELRIVELLDDLCDKMQDYTLKKVVHTCIKIPL